MKRLEIRIKEHKDACRWGELPLLNMHGTTTTQYCVRRLSDSQMEEIVCEGSSAHPPPTPEDQRFNSDVEFDYLVTTGSQLSRQAMPIFTVAMTEVSNGHVYLMTCFEYIILPPL